LDWIDCLASSLGDRNVSSMDTCVTNIIVFSNKGSNVWYLDDGLKMIFNHFHILGFSACCDEVITSFTSSQFCSWFCLF
jgi:hypothetical protein